jgi:large subunit ribosomal protein L32e
MTEKKASPARKALQVRARARNKKPKFVRAESWKYDRFSLSWRKPRGLDNKIRRKIKGWPPGPSMGYKGPKIARFLHPSGYEEVIVYNVADLANVDVNSQAVRIGHTVGKRKRTDIIAKARELNLKILNMKLSAETKEAAEGEEEKEEEGKETEETEEAEAAEKEEVAKEEKKPKKETKKTTPKKSEAKKEKKETKPKKKETKKQ